MHNDNIIFASDQFRLKFDKNIKSNLSLELDYIIQMQDKIEQFKPSCI